MTKFKSSMVTRDILFLIRDTCLVVVKKGFTLLSVVSANRYLPSGSNENKVGITRTGNVFVTRWIIPLETIPLLDFAIIQ